MKKKTTEEKKKVAVTNNTANTASEATTNKEAYENSKNKLTENLKNHLWDNSREETLQMIDDFMGRVHNENYSIATTNLISKIVDNIKELVIERYEAKDDSKFYAREFDAIRNSGVAFTPIIIHPINCHKVNTMALGNCIRMSTMKKAS